MKRNKRNVCSFPVLHRNLYMFKLLLRGTRPIPTWPFLDSPPESSFPFTAYVPATSHHWPYSEPPLPLPALVPLYMMFPLPGMSCILFSIWRPPRSP